MKKVFVGITLGVLASLVTSSASSHGFGERYDLPMPLNLFLVGAGATVALSFVVIAIFVKSGSAEIGYPRYNLLKMPLLGPVMSSELLITIIRLLSVCIFLLVVATGLFGNNTPIENLSPTFVWIIFWVGMGYVSALFGNVWAMINPWKIIFEWFEGLMGVQGGVMFKYPEYLDTWPAVVLFLIFGWLENVYPQAAVPLNLSGLILLYSSVTWIGMLLFGKHTWLRYGEFFSVLFGLFAKFSPTEVRLNGDKKCRKCIGCNLLRAACVDCYECFEKAGEWGVGREFNLRPYAVGLVLVSHLSISRFGFVILTLALVTFDGLSETPLWRSIQNTFYSSASAFGTDGLGVINTAGLIVMPLAFLGLYLGFTWATRLLSREDSPVLLVARVFVISLIPIALAYNLAHYIGLFLVQGQFLIPLASDPFGQGWDILATSGYKIRLNLIGTKAIWYISVIAIVLGHFVSVYVAHTLSLGRQVSRSDALRGQYPMLLLMVIYTAISLWIIAQPIVER